MDFKNLYVRSLIAIIILSIYLFLSFYNFNLILYLGVLIYFFIFFEISKYFKQKNKLIFLYVFISLISFIIYIKFFKDFKEFNLMLFNVIVFDTFSYFSGKLIGRKKIFTYISPNKTVEGLLGGIIITNILSSLYIHNYLDDFFFKMIFVNFIILTSLLGDLTQSYFKRINNLKDSSNYLPGHGGFFDRFDSFIMSIIFLSIYSFLI